MIKKIARVILGPMYSPLQKRWQKRNEMNREKNTLRKNADSILSYKNKFNPNIFIETGTYKGDMLNIMKKHFNKLYSIEIGEELFKKAVSRFSNDKNVEVLLGDSSTVLPKILSQLNEPALFWLDAHDSGGDTAHGDLITPIEKELETIFAHKVKNHVILIDDARDFTGRGGYPSAQAIEDRARKYGYLFEMKDDNFRLFPKK